MLFPQGLQGDPRTCTVLPEQLWQPIIHVSQTLSWRPSICPGNRDLEITIRGSPCKSFHALEQPRMIRDSRKTNGTYRFEHKTSYVLKQQPLDQGEYISQIYSPCLDCVSSMLHVVSLAHFAHRLLTEDWDNHTGLLESGHRHKRRLFKKSIIQPSW